VSLEIRDRGPLQLVVPKDRLERVLQWPKDVPGANVFVVEPAVDDVADEERLARRFALKQIGDRAGEDGRAVAVLAPAALEPFEPHVRVGEDGNPPPRHGG
jgi:hypothetical protein